MKQLSLFQANKSFSAKWYIFKESELGKIYATIPWEQLSDCLPEEKQNRPGPGRWFTNSGMFGLMFLKHYTNLSDEQVKDRAIVARIRSYISKHANLLDDVQKQLIFHWQGMMEHTVELQMDASCYESHLRFPSDAKLLWECCQWVYDKQLFPYCKREGIKRPRNKYSQQAVKQLTYHRKKKKPYKQTRSRVKSLLQLLSKGLVQLKGIAFESVHGPLPTAFYLTPGTVEKVLEQQQYLFDHHGSRVDSRIVSLHKPYVRPIKRGKENKPTEFGMKLHKIQVDGGCFIDTMDFDNFNECTRLKPCVARHEEQFGECSRLGADRIYATNENRSFLTPKHMVTCFPKKGKDNSNKEERQNRSLIGKTRATRLEGSFGNEKNHYGLRKIKALSAGTEKVWVFFGIMTAKAVLLSKRQTKPRQTQPA